MHDAPPRPLEILPVDDNPADVRPTVEALRNMPPTKPASLGPFIDVLRPIEGFWTHVARLPA